MPYSSITRDMPARLVVSNIIGFLYLMLVFYIFYLWLTPFFLNRKKLGTFFGISFLVVLIMPFFGYTLLFLSRAIFDGSFKNFYNGYSIKVHMSGYYPVLTSAVFGSFFSVIVNWFTTMNQKSESDKQRLAIELDLLKSKLNPHFLFNTLNNIDSLITTNPDEASAALIRLSEIMRYLTYETAAEFVELSREVEYIRNYIELQRIRVKSPDDIRFRAEGDLNCLISPALFVPLLENSFKFVSFHEQKPAIDINLNSFDGIVVLEISNSYEKQEDGQSTRNSGFGLMNLSKRLDLSYPGKYNLNIEPTERKYTVKLKIDTNGD
jgi:two-component system, LytTR family, sensor kinase